MAAQLMATKAPPARGEALCTAWANSSLPVPVSPMRSTGRGVRLIFFNMVMHRSRAGDCPTTLSKVYLAR